MNELKQKQINIVILGAGFAGVTSALNLSKNFKERVNITIIDRQDYHLFTTNLYEVASSEEELASLAQLKKSIALPLSEIFFGRKVSIVKAEIKGIDADARTVTAGIKQYKYDYLIVASGSTSDFFGIPGAEKFSLPLKSLSEAFAIRNQVEFAIQRHKGDMKRKNIRIAVAGGGYTGVEIASELSSLLNLLSLKYDCPRNNIDVVVIEAAFELIPGLSKRLSVDAHSRLRDLGVRILLSSPILGVDQHFIEFQGGERMEYDVLIWAAGVKARNLPFMRPIETDKRGRILTNQFLQSQKHPNIFAAGDMACIINPDGKPAPPTAQDAIFQGGYIAYALPYILKNQKPPKAYRGKIHGYIVSIGGKWAILNYGGFYFKGFFGYLFRQAANFNYFRQIVGFWKALKYVLFQMELYGRND